MAIARRFKISHHEVFPHGAFIVAPVAPVLDFDQSTRDVKVQQVDKDTGELIWSIDVLDADPEAPRKSKTVSIKILAKVQPVPPANDSNSPFTPVEFDGLTALAYIDDNGNRPRIAWSFRAGLDARTWQGRPEGDGIRRGSGGVTCVPSTRSPGRRLSASGARSCLGRSRPRRVRSPICTRT